MQTTIRIVHTSLLSAAVALACGGATAQVATVSAVGASASKVTPAKALPEGAQFAGVVANDKVIHITVSLRMRDRAKLDARIASRNFVTRNTAAPAMSGAEFMAEHAPTAERAQAVVDYLAKSGFKNVQLAPNRLLITADGTADVVQSAFQTTLSRVVTKDGREAYANSEPASVPADLANDVLAILGLQDVARVHLMNRTVDASGPIINAITGHNPAEFSSIYGGSGVANAAGVRIGILADGNLSRVISSLNRFTSNNSFPTVTTQTVGTATSDTQGIGEWELDSQSIVGAGGGQVGSLVFYMMPDIVNGSSIASGINTAVTDGTAKIVNGSLGYCETDAQNEGLIAAGDQSLAQAVAQGQTFSFSTGDSGANECGTSSGTPASWPADSQYVVAVSGTRLDASTGAGATWNGETVWSGSGGSQSTIVAKPSWQTLWSGTKRGVADVAFDGDPNSGALVVDGTSTQQIGGTSLSSPIFVGLWARVMAVKGNLGFAAPLLYQLPAGDFHDITSGSNGLSAGAGYDVVSGRGSLILNSAINHLGSGGSNVPPVANFSVTTSGLSASFTDSSTDSDGTIASRAWNFGDGGTSTATNPSHTYASAGTYTVTLTVTDNGNASNTKTQSVTVSGGGGGGSTQLLSNTGFESGTTPWTGTTGDICTTACGSESPHAGSYFVWLDGYGTTHTENITQAVTIPAGKTSATLQYYLHIDTAETTTTTAYDTLKVQVLNSSGTVLATLQTYSNLNKNSGYAVRTNDLSAYIGQSVQIRFLGAEDSSLQTSFVIDDVTLTVQ